jgi:hypothetical protein
VAARVGKLKSRIQIGAITEIRTQMYVIPVTTLN